MKTNAISREREAAENSVAAWMLTLEMARARGDAVRVAESLAELARRGVRVTYETGAERREAAHV